MHTGLVPDLRTRLDAVARPMATTGSVTSSSARPIATATVPDAQAARFASILAEASGGPAEAAGGSPTAAADAITLDSARFAALTTATRNQPNLGGGVVTGALDHLGTPYLWGGNDADVGVDCSGLVRDAFRDIGVDMPRVSRDQARMGVEVDGIGAALPGDLLAFGEPVNHVAIYLGDNKMVHAPRRGDVVKVETIDRPIATIRRIVDTTRPAGATWTSLEAGVPFGPEQFQSLFVAAGDRWNIDPALLAAVAQVESNFDPTAVSGAGAQGLMQFMPATASGMGVDPLDPASAIDGAARYLRENLDRFGTVPLALAAYNAGPGAVQRHGGIPPYDETQRYVRKVQEIWSRNAA